MKFVQKILRGTGKYYSYQNHSKKEKYKQFLLENLACFQEYDIKDDVAMLVIIEYSNKWEKINYGDVENLVKPINDVLQGLNFFENDKQVKILTVIKTCFQSDTTGYSDDTKCGIDITVVTLENQDDVYVIINSATSVKQMILKNNIQKLEKN